MATMHSALHTAMPHVHLIGDECPYCEQPIPNDRLEEVTKRIQAKDRARQADADAKTKAEVDALRQQSQAQIEGLKADAANREAAALSQGRKLAEEALQSKLAEAAEAARVAEEYRAQSQTQIEALKADAVAREAAALAQGRKLAEAALEAKLAEAAETAKVAMERGAALEDELTKSRTALTATVDKLNKDFVVKEETARLEARTAAVQELGVKIAEAESAKAAAEKKAVELQAQQEVALAARVAEVREAMEKAKTDAVNAERSKIFEEKLKLEALVEELQRKLQNKTAEELGDGAEIDLFEVLKAEFPDDDIRRVGKGKPGADIIHKVRRNGAVCGCIVYDSKNHQQWRNDHVAKLRQDQLAEKAEHAVLSTHAFPKDRRELHIDSNVIIAKPGRAVVIAMILRKQIVQLHSLKVSNEERSRKTDELYTLMTSDRFQQFMSTVTKTAEQLEALQLQERKAHDSVWKKQGELFRTIVRSCSQFDEEIGRIVGTAA